MKIGIVTFHAAHNYGAVLQAYALQTHLKKVGHEPFFINYQYKFQKPRRLDRYLVWPWYLPNQVVYSIIGSLYHRFFSHFCEKHLKIGDDRHEDYLSLQRAPPVADVYICGSDQIWNPNLCRFEMDEHVSWLDFGDENIRRVAYAASFGVRDIDRAICKRLAFYAKRFHAVSVREKNGVELMQMLGRTDAMWVPDPTLLLDASEYELVEVQSTRQNPYYCFSYQVGSDTAELGLRLKKAVNTILGMSCRVCHPNIPRDILLIGGLISPGEWINRLRRSEFVITNSFHGLTMSLVFHRPFIIMLRDQGVSELNIRITSLLDVVGLRSRAVSTFNPVQIKRLCYEEIDWTEVNDRLKQFCETGVRFINEALA